MKKLPDYSKRLVVAGSRSYNNYDEFEDVMNRYVKWWGIQDLAIISGNAVYGADAMVIRYCKENNIPYFLYPANWDKYGKRAGIIRNCEMRDACTHLLAFWDKVSRGTAHMVEICYERDSIKTMLCLVQPDEYQSPANDRTWSKRRFKNRIGM